MAAAASTTKSKPSPPRQCRLPITILPNSGRIKIRIETGGKAVLYDRPGPRGRQNANGRHGSYPSAAVPVGAIRFDETVWRVYDSVHYDTGLNQHFLAVRLTDEERRQAASITHGWARYEDLDKNHPISAGKTSRRSRFVQYRKSVVLISLFDGICGGRVAMDRLPDHFNVVATFSSEKDANAKAVVHRYDPTIVELPDVQDIDRVVVWKQILGNAKVREAMQCTYYPDDLQFIVLAGPPCQDLSRANMNSSGVVKGALAGERSRLFFHVPRIVRYIADAVHPVWGQLCTHYLVENVEMSARNEKLFTTFLDNVPPWRVDFNEGGCCASLMSRRRLYFSSVESAPEGGRNPIGRDKFARAQCIHPAKAEGKTVDDVLAAVGYGEWKFANAIGGQLPTLTRRKEQGGQDRYLIEHRDDPTRTRDAPQILNEDLLGFPRNHTQRGADNRLLSEAERRLLLGNTFCVFHVQYLLKKMHGGICQPSDLRRGGLKMPRLPQDLCADMLAQPNLADRKLFLDAEKVINEILKFGDYDQKLKNTLWASLVPRK